MGQNKALVAFNGVPLALRAAQRLARLTEGDGEIFLTANPPERVAALGLPTIADQIQGIGPLGGLHAAMKYAHYPVVVVVACDMPFLNVELLEAQIRLLEDRGVDVVVPLLEGGYEPLHAVYQRDTCLPAIEAAIAREQRRLISWFPAVKVLEMDEDAVEGYDPDLRSFLNVNTPEELAAAEALARGEEG